MKADRTSQHSAKRLEDLIEVLVRRTVQDPFSIYFVTGTDTGVGKTFVTCKLLQMLGAHKVPAVGFKPICCGDRRDAQKLWKNSGGDFDLDVVNPIHLPLPVAPMAQRNPGWSLILARVCRGIRIVRDHGIRLVLMEGAGGLLCPIAPQHTMRELARAVNARMMVVAPDRLGVLNHTLLTVEAAGKRHVEAIVLNAMKRKSDLSRKSNARVLSRWTRLPIYSIHQETA